MPYTCVRAPCYSVRKRLVRRDIRIVKPAPTTVTGPLGSTVHVLRADAETVVALAAIDWNRRFRRVGPSSHPVRMRRFLTSTSGRVTRHYREALVGEARIEGEHRSVVYLPRSNHGRPIDEAQASSLRVHEQAPR